jgi:hypothetical protein
VHDILMALGSCARDPGRLGKGDKLRLPMDVVFYERLMLPMDALSPIRILSTRTSSRNTLQFVIHPL